MHREPDFFAHLRSEFSSWRLWLDRAFVLGYAIAAGAFVVLFTLMSDWASAQFLRLYDRYPAAVLLTTPALTALIVWATRRYFPAAAGSGIPQVKAALDTASVEGPPHLFVSLRLTVAKMGLGVAGFLAGLSIGREGPSVQVAAGVMQHARRWLSPKTSIDARGLSITGAPERLTRWRSRHPVLFAAVCGLTIAVIGLVTAGATFGSGSEVVKDMLQGHGEMTPVATLLKFVATWLSAWCGVPGGIFAPSLSIGAGIGHAVALIFESGLGPPLIALGMAAFLAAVTQAPLTAFIIVMEMVDGHAMVLSLMAAAMLASLISRMISRPLYDTLAQHMLSSSSAPRVTLPHAATTHKDAGPPHL